jgi:hypothetical protein
MRKLVTLCPLTQLMELLSLTLTSQLAPSLVSGSQRISKARQEEILLVQLLLPMEPEQHALSSMDRVRMSKS